MKALIFAGSNSSTSINLQLARFASSFLINAEISELTLTDFDMPIFSVDTESKHGHQEKAKVFLEKISLADKIILSLAEHNGSYSAAFKNILDWSSRINDKPFQNKDMLLMSTSPGVRAGASVLEAATKRFPFLGANIVSTFSLPEFHKNFSEGAGITHPEHLQKLKEAVRKLQ